jgi:hypothetical protein
LVYLCRAGVGKQTTVTDFEAVLWAHFAVYTKALTDAATLVDADVFYVINGTTPKKCTATEIATYVQAELWAAAPAASVLTTDTVMIYRSGTGYKTATVEQIGDAIGADLQTTILDLSGLSDATIAGSDYMLLSQGSTARHITVAEFEADTLDAMAAYLTALDAVTTPADANLLYCTQGGTAKKLTLDDLALYILDRAQTLPWLEISSGKYTAAPATTSTITMSDTSDFAVGVPVRYKIATTYYYGIVTAVATNSAITIAGAPLSGVLVELWVGLPQQVEQVELRVSNGHYDGAAQDLLAAIEETYFVWRKAAARLVSFAVVHHNPDSGASQPKVNVKIDGNLVGTEDSTKGPQLSAVAGDWVYSSAVAISVANYAIAYGGDIELRCTTAGSTGDAECLTVALTFVYE